MDTARELGCDENEFAFDEKLRRIGSAKLPFKRKKTGRRTAASKEE